MDAVGQLGDRPGFLETLERDGSDEHNLIERAGMASLAGLDPMEILGECDPVLSLIHVAVIERRWKLAEDERQNLAVKIANALR